MEIDDAEWSKTAQKEIGKYRNGGKRGGVYLANADFEPCREWWIHDDRSFFGESIQEQKSKDYVGRHECVLQNLLLFFAK